MHNLDNDDIEGACLPPPSVALPTVIAALVVGILACRSV